MKPPKTIRFCPCSLKERKYEYNRAVGHSRCRTCGCPYSFLDKENFLARGGKINVV